MKIIECVPNVSEGRDRSVLDAIAASVRAVNGCELLDVDPGAETNRTVFTFVGGPEAVREAAFQLARTATQLIDMRRHSGAHARMGAVDVVPFVPVGGGAEMADCVELARATGARIADELGVPVYLYEHAAGRPERRSLADVRRGEYEGLARKLEDPEWTPDFGEARHNERSGATVVGARPFLIAYNVNLNTRDRRLAHDIALDIREQGRFARRDDGSILRDEKGAKVRKPGLHRAVRGVGWFIPEFGRAQVSMNLTDYKTSSLHEVFESIRDGARRRGLRVTGSEIVGLVPREAILATGRHYLESQGVSRGVPEPDVVEAARVSLGLDDVKPFEPGDAIIEYRLRPRRGALTGLEVTGFADELSRSSPAPGGGSVAALAGALGAALAAMVATLAYKGAGARAGTDRSADARMEQLGERAQALRERLLAAVDDDTAAFDAIGAARRRPKKTDDEKTERDAAIQRAVLGASLVPLSVVECAAELAELAGDVARDGLDATVTDAGVAAWCARVAAEGAALNVRINLPGLDDAQQRAELERRSAEALRSVREIVPGALEEVEKKLAEAE